MYDLLSSPDGEDFFYKPLETAAKRRWESEGRIPSGRFGRQPNRNPVPPIAKRFNKEARIRERSET